MNHCLQSLYRFLADDDGPTAVEYAVLLALIIVVCIAAVTSLGQTTAGMYNNIALNGVLSGS